MPIICRLLIMPIACYLLPSICHTIYSLFWHIVCRLLFLTDFLSIFVYYLLPIIYCYRDGLGWASEG